MTINQDGNVVGRIGALAVIALTLWGVHRVSCNEGYCPTMQKASSSCCMGEAKGAPSPAPAAK